MNFALIKQQAKAGMAGGWFMGALCMLVCSLVNSAASTIVVGSLLIAGPMAYGTVAYFMHQNDYHQQDLNRLFSGFSRFVDTMVAGLLMSLAISVGLVLLIVPGIIIACGLSMTFFIMAENPNISGVDALKASWNLMNGHKWEYFCLMFSFIGWAILSVLTCGIGFLFLSSYITVTELHYYRLIAHGYSGGIKA